MSLEVACFGVLGQPAEEKISKGGKPYLRFSMRVGDGDVAQWISVLSFDPDALDRADRFVKGARCYVEGRLSLSEWTNSDGVVRTGLSVMSFHTRLSAIGRGKPRRDGEKVSESYRNPRSAPANRLPASGGAPWEDDIGF